MKTIGVKIYSEYLH